MSMQLAELLCYASGFAVEPYEIVNLLEQFGGIAPVPSQIISSGVDVFQIESRNPHLHEEKGEEHIKEMLLSSMSSIYYSQICSQKVREKLISTCADHGFKIREGELQCPVKIRPPSELNINNFIEMLKKSETLIKLGR
jgi:mannosyl-3-phosphoglycerate synthase